MWKQAAVVFGISSNGCVSSNCRANNNKYTRKKNRVCVSRQKELESKRSIQNSFKVINIIRESKQKYVSFLKTTTTNTKEKEKNTKDKQ